MAEVHAVKDVADINAVERKLRMNGWGLSADLWRIGINLALRVSDLLVLRYDQLEGEFLEVVEGKTNKPRRIKINSKAREVINRRRLENPGAVYVFEASTARTSGRVKPVSRAYVSRHFKAVGDEMGLELGTHSMRKTRGWAMHSAGVPIEQIARVLNHSSPAVTMRYIGLTQADIDKTYDDFVL